MEHSSNAMRMGNFLMRWRRSLSGSFFCPAEQGLRLTGACSIVLRSGEQADRSKKWATEQPIMGPTDGIAFVACKMALKSARLMHCCPG
jgi:hypothetical protein